jgi:SAM-dependent methyltransferase
VDPGRCVSDFARGKGLDVRIGTLRDMRFADESFDAAFLWCCFDQMPAPEQELRELERVLEGGGRLLIRVPNADFVRTTRALVDLRALAFSGLAGFPFQVGYSAAVLRDLLEDAGFCDVRVRNQINLRGGGATRSSPWAIPEKTRTLRRVHAWSQLVYHASFGRVVRGPWIEATCKKRQRTLRCRAARPVEAEARAFEALTPLPQLAS